MEVARRRVNDDGPRVNTESTVRHMTETSEWPEKDFRLGEAILDRDIQIVNLQAENARLTGQLTILLDLCGDFQLNNGMMVAEFIERVGNLTSAPSAAPAGS